MNYKTNRFTFSKLIFSSWNVPSIIFFCIKPSYIFKRIILSPSILTSLYAWIRSRRSSKTRRGRIERPARCTMGPVAGPTATDPSSECQQRVALLTNRGRSPRAAAAVYYSRNYTGTGTCLRFPLMSCLRAFRNIQPIIRDHAWSISSSLHVSTYS